MRLFSWELGTSMEESKRKLEKTPKKQEEEKFFIVKKIFCWYLILYCSPLEIEHEAANGITYYSHNLIVCLGRLKQRLINDEKVILLKGIALLNPLFRIFTFFVIWFALAFNFQAFYEGIFLGLLFYVILRISSDLKLKGRLVILKRRVNDIDYN